MSSPFNNVVEEVVVEEVDESYYVSICSVIIDMLENSEVLDDEELFDICSYTVDFPDS